MGYGDNVAYSYVLEVDSEVKKRIIAQTHRHNGEAHEYTFLMDAMNSLVNLTDDAGNSISIFTDSNKIEIKNSSGTSITLEGPTVTIHGDVVVTGSVRAPVFYGSIGH